MWTINVKKAALLMALMSLGACKIVTPVEAAKEISSLGSKSTAIAVEPTSVQSPPVIISDFVVVEDVQPTQPAPTPNPTPVWVPGALVAGGWAKARADCFSIYENAETKRVGLVFEYLKAGIVVRVISPGLSHNDAEGVFWSTENPNGGEAIYVSEKCLEGGMPV